MYIMMIQHYIDPREHVNDDVGKGSPKINDNDITKSIISESARETEREKERIIM